MVSAARYQDTGSGSFFGNMAYESILKRHTKHFLVILNQLIDWQRIGEELLPLYKGEGSARPAAV